MNADPYWGSKIELTRHIIDLIRKRFNMRKKAYEIVDKCRSGEVAEEDLSFMREMSKTDLIVQMDLLPLAQLLADPRYQTIIQEITEAEQSHDIDRIIALRKNLLSDLDFPNRGEIISRLNDTLKMLTQTAFNCTFEVWEQIRFTIAGIFPQFVKVLKETTQMRKSLPHAHRRSLLRSQCYRDPT